MPVSNVLPRLNADYQKIDSVIGFIGMSIEDKKKRMEMFFQTLKSIYKNKNQYLQEIDKLQDVNHLRPVVEENRAFDLLSSYLGLQSSIEEDNGYEASFLFDLIKQKVIELNF